MTAVEMKRMNPKYSCEILGIYRAPYEDTLTIERLASVTLPTRNLTTRNIIGGDLNLPQAEWKWEAEKANGFQAMVNRLDWDNGYTQEVNGLKEETHYCIYAVSNLKFRLSLVIICAVSANMT